MFNTSFLEPYDRYLNQDRDALSDLERYEQQTEHLAQAMALQVSKELKEQRIRKELKRLK